MRDAVPSFRVGTASWTDPTLIASGAFYPPQVKSAEDRLRFYAEHFDTVEVDSSYYALPSQRNSELWSARTPAGFLFHFKAFAAMTRHPVEVARLPVAIREQLGEEDRRERTSKHLPPPAQELAFDMFDAALQPLRDAGKLGFIVFQFPPWFTATRGNARYIEECRDRLPEQALAVEFRHAGWVAEERRERTLDMLRSLGLAYVIVDAPQVGSSSMPALCETTAREAYVRFHGRNREAWNRRGISAAERYKYLYSEGELADWAGRLRRLDVAAVNVLFNNCYAHFGVMNAGTMKQLLSHA